MRAIRIHARGGVDVMQLEEAPRPEPGPGEVLIAVHAAGINLADIGQRNGEYPNLVELPTTLGYEVAGTVAELGPGVQRLRPGMRVVSHVEGGYADYAVARAMEVAPLPPNVGFAEATAIPIQGITAFLLLHDAARISEGEAVLVHAAAGGVGTLAIQVARLLGAGTVIGTSRTESKHALIRELGADAALSTTAPDWVEAVRGATDGRGADAILDPVGGAVGRQSLEALAPFGRLVVYGSLSGERTPLVAQQLIRGCQTVTGFNTPAYPPQAMGRAVGTLLQWLAAGQLRIVVDRTVPLEEAAAAHRHVEAGESVGKVALRVR